MRDNDAVRFALLVCEPHTVAFYQARGWHAFEGEVYCEQPDGRIRFEAMAPFVFDIRRAPRQGVIDLRPAVVMASLAADVHIAELPVKVATSGIART